MNPKSRFNLIAMIVVLTMFASAIWTVPALADDGAPPPPTGGDSSTATASSSTPAVLSHVPAGTDVAVVDHNGRKVSLASQEAAELIAGGDPIYCPSSVGVPVASASGCSANFTSFKEVVDYLNSNPKTAAGTIWISKSYDSSVDDLLGTVNFTLDGTLVGTTANFALTLKGGWNGLGTGTVDTTDPSVFNADSLTIDHWNGDVTLSDIAITGTTGGANALHVVTNKNITLTRVNSHNNGAALIGAFIDNSGGTGNILVSSSHFDNNQGAEGLLANSHGTITLTNVTAIGNSAGMGAFLDNHTAPIAKNVMLTGDNTFSNNFTDGLDIETEGAITINDLTANHNGITGGHGAVLNNFLGTAAPVTLTGTTILTENYGGGLFINSHGAIKANNVIANSNTHGYGAFLINSGATTAQPITFTGTNQFKYNYDDGLDVTSNGLISLNNITASYNSHNVGATLTNSGGSFSSGITLTGTNTFNGNYYSGLVVSSDGSVNLHSVTADDNGLLSFNGNGLYIFNGGSGVKPVTLSGTNTFNNNYLDGLYLGSKGMISLSNITANDSVNGDGANIYNNLPLASGPIVISGTNNFNNNKYTGLNVLSYGAITTNSITANDNGLGGFGYGANLDNCIYISGCTTVSTQPVTVNGMNVFNGNYDYGLKISSKGTIKVNSATANSNGLAPSSGYGLSLENCQWDGVSTCTGTGSIVVSGTSVLNSNYTGGAYIFTSGTVSLSNITASTNFRGYGLSVSNLTSGSLTPKNVTISGTNVFNNNWDEGLNISTYGTITLNNITANENGQSGTFGGGASLYSYTGTLPRDVILTGTNTFNNNYGDGLDVNTLGNIKISNLHAIGGSMTGTGAYLSNQYGSVTTGVTLSGTNLFNSNYYDGLNIYSWGAITMSNVTASDNGLTALSGTGATLNNYTGTLIKNVTLTGTNVFDHNYGNGLNIYSLGSIKVNNLSASDNVHGIGADLSNTSGLTTSTSSITLTGISNFNSNAYSGLSINSYGAISVSTTSLSAIKNGLVYSTGYGIYLNNSSSTAVLKPGISLKGNNTLDGNYTDGLYIDTYGAVSLNSIHASGTTGGTGAQVANHTLGKAVILTGINVFNSNSNGGLSIGSMGPVTLSSVTASDNINTGLSINTQGAITLKNITASDTHTAEGANLNNSSGSPQAVTLSGINVFNNNFDDGLYILSLGAISMSNVTANGNSQSGVDVDNHTGTAGVTMTGVNTAIGNTVSGFHIHTTGAVTLTSLTADGNTATGLAIDASAANVKLTCGSFTNNLGNGVNVSTSGTLTLIGVVASGNSGSNIFFAGTPIIVRNCPLTP